MYRSIREKDLHSEPASCWKKTNGGVGRREFLALRTKRQVELARHRLPVGQYQVLCVANQFGGICLQAAQGVLSERKVSVNIVIFAELESG